MLDILPDRVKSTDAFKDLADRLAELKRILLDKRAPRVAVVGRRGAGKSALFNALVGAKVLPEGSVDTTKDFAWEQYTLSDGGTVDWLDTPGLGAGNLKADRIGMLRDEFKTKRPDVIVFIHKASEVDSEVDATLDDLRQIVECTVDEGRPCEMLVVLNQVDGLPSPADVIPPYKPAKRDKIDTLAARMEELLRNAQIEFKKVIPAASYFDDDCDLRFQIDVVAMEIAGIVPSEALLDSVASFKYRKLQKAVADKIINIFCVACSCVALLPIPMSDIIPLTALQVLMITAIGYLGGKRLNDVDVKEFIAALGLLLAAATSARQLVKIVIPIFGEGVSAAVAGATTKAIGMAAVAYYIDNESMEEVKRKFKLLK